LFTHTSDHFDAIYEYAKQAINDDLAYMDCTPHEEMKQERREMKESKYRNQDKKETLELFERMYKGEDAVKEYCLRIRIPTSFWPKNSAMRDPVIFRMNKETSHHRTGTKYKAYPTYVLLCWSA
jgi:glutamyl/glutaminyl-tRNA synthetase